MNPDFGQVEADPSEVNLSTYETFFEERRPFFIEGKNLLDFKIIDDDGPMSNDVLFYSRRVGRSPSYRPDLDDNEYADIPDNTTILGAFKVTGKTSDGWSVGILNSVTRREVALIDMEGDRRNETVEPLTNYLASRVMKGNAYSAGLNFRHQWKDKT